MTAVLVCAGLGWAQQEPQPDAPVKQPEPADPAYPDVVPPGEETGGEQTGEPADLGAALESAVQKYQDKVTVSSGARSQKLSEVPMTLSYLAAEDIEGTGQFSLCDTIQLFPGLECRRGAMRQATVSTRGLGFNFMSNRLLLMKDGRPETDPWTGGFQADEANPLTNVKQVEVIRGPGSSLYGSNAFAGVINLITRSPDDLIKKGNSVGADGRFLVGTHDTYRVQATAAGKVADLKGLLNYYFGTSQGTPQFTDARREIVDTQQWSRVHQISGKVEYKVLKVDAAYTDSELARPGGDPSAVVGNCGRCHYTARDQEHVQQFYGQAVADVPITSWLSIVGRGFVNMKRRSATIEHQITGLPVEAVGLRLRVGGDVRANIQAGPVNIVAGGDVRIDEVDNPNRRAELARTDLSVKNLGVYADAELRLARRLILGAGLRYDGYLMSEALWKNNTGELSPRASIVFQAFPTLTLRANYGHAFRAPTMVELGIRQRMYASTLLGNAYLKPERLDTFEVAVDGWPFGEILRLTGTGFYTRATNFINEVPIDSNTAQFDNIGGGTLAGAELEAASQIPKINTSVNVSYQFLFTRDDEHRRSFDYAPQHRLQFRARTTIAQVAFVDLYGAYVGTRYDPALVPTTHLDQALQDRERIMLPGYLIASVRLGWKVIDNLTISGGATNIFNTQYEESLGFPAADTTLFAELKFTY